MRSAVSLASFFVLCHSPMVLADGESSAPAADIYNKAVRLYEKHKWAAAKEYFHQYLAEYSDTPLYITCLYYLAYCYQQLKEIPQAIIIYHKVMEKANPNGPFHGDSDAFWGEMAEKRVRELSPQ